MVCFAICVGNGQILIFKFFAFDCMYNITLQSQCHFSDHIILQDVKNDLAVVEEHGTDDQCMTVQNPSQISGQRWTSASPSPQWGTEAGTIYLSYFTRVVVCGW